MTNRFTTLAAAAAIFIGFSAPASAEMKHLQTIGHWQIKTNDRICDASGSFRDGTRLELTINAKGVLVVTVVNPKWSIPEGKYQVEMQVDQAQLETFQAEAKDNYVMWGLPLDEASINLLSYGKTLRAWIGSAVIAYDLTYSQSVVKALGQCALTRLASANPFANAAPQASAPPANPFAETASNPYRRM